MKLLQYLILCGLLIFSCKNKENTNAIPANSEPNLKELKAAAPPMAKLDMAFINQAEAQADVPELTDKIWHYNFALSLKETTPKENIYLGKWIDFLPKGHYQLGLYDKTTETGRFVFDKASSLLEMRSVADTSYEWKVKMDPNTLILIGTSKYGNNPWQMKLIRKDEPPTATQ